MGLVDRVHNSGFIVTNQGDEIKRFQIKMTKLKEMTNPLEDGLL